MCGIFCFKGNSNTSFLLDSLKKLEYRGYDSCGILYKNEEMVIKKAVGDVSKLKSIVEDVSVNLALSHTRWATHGGVSLLNSHPHNSFDELVYLVHNGIIENGAVLKETYIPNVKLYGDTDSEIIANLISYFLRYDKPLEVIEKLIDILEGTYAICFIIKGDDNIYFLKDKSPLVIGEGKENLYISSDIYALPKDVYRYMNVANKEYGYIGENILCSGGLRFLDFNINDCSETSDGYKMIEEIKEEPYLVDDLIDYVNNLNEESVDIFSKYKSLTIIGSGSSYYAGMYISKIYEDIYKKHAYLYLASEFNFKLPTLDDDTLILLISQSGETLDIIDSCDLVKEYKTILFTNNVYSTLSNQVDIVYDICAKKEYGVAATKTFNQTVLLAYLLFRRNKGKSFKEVEAYQKRLEEIIKEDICIDKLVNSNKVFYIGVGYDYVATLEGALKLKEITYVPCEGYSANELKHGTLSLIDQDTTVIALSSSIKSNLVNTLSEVKSRGGNVIYIKEDRFLPYLGALLIITRLQMVAYKLAISKKLNPDRPRNLAKSVTVR